MKVFLPLVVTITWVMTIFGLAAWVQDDTLYVTGNLPSPCHQLVVDAIEIENALFVEVTSTPPPVACPLRFTHFEMEFPLSKYDVVWFDGEDIWNR